jgi:putative ABC transport system permease protein
LLVEHLVLTLAAAAVGIVIGWAVAPLLAGPGAGLLGVAGPPLLTVSTAAIVVGTAVAVAALATLVPAGRAARTSTILALADASRPPRRSALLVAASGWLPTTLLLGLRLASRRPRRLALSTLSVTVTVAGIVAVLVEHLRLNQSAGLTNPQTQRLNQVLLVITFMLVVLATVNALLITWATVLDTRHATALARALGATPRQVSAALSTAQLLPAIPGSVLGIPLGLGLVHVVGKTGDAYKLAPIWQYILVILLTWVVTTLLTTIPTRFGMRQPTAHTLEADLG